MLWPVSDRGGIVRQARRPAGWEAPGPRPAGPGEREELWPAEGEDLCYLTGEFRIFQRIDGHRWSLDDLVTAWMATRDRGPDSGSTGASVSRALDLGCGIGSVLMMVAWAHPRATCVGVEAQQISHDLCARSLTYNGLAARVDLRLGDLRDPSVLAGQDPFDLITGTPPYFDVADGVVSTMPQKGPCRFELRGGVEAYCETAARHLAPHGRFFVCEDARQVPRVETAAAAAGLTVRRRLDTIPRAGKPALFSVFELRRAERGAEHGMAAQEALVVRHRDGKRTDAFVGVRAAMGLPP